MWLEERYEPFYETTRHAPPHVSLPASTLNASIRRATYAGLTLESRLLTVKSASPEQWDRIYREEIIYLIERDYLEGAILVLWLAYLVWKWVRAFREFRQVSF